MSSLKPLHMKPYAALKLPFRLNFKIPHQGFNHFDSYQMFSKKCIRSSLSFDKKKKKNHRREGVKEKPR